MKACFLIKLADDTKPRRGADTLEGRAAIPRNQDRQEGWVNRNLMISSKDKPKGLPWSGLSPCGHIG